jgi:FrmR/RcnR family transcriptional regulator, repressor of frmRAB operon
MTKIKDWNAAVQQKRTDCTKLLNRAKRIRGQMEALERAIIDEKNCVEFLHFIVAARGGLNGLMTKVIEDHFRLNVVDRASDFERAKNADEVIEAVQSYLR